MVNYLKSVVYKFIDIATFGRGINREIGGVFLRFPVKYSRYYEADYESETFVFLKTNLQNGSTFMDIGGHIGLFAVTAAKLVGANGKVFSFEPTPSSRGVLTDTVRLNNCSETVEIRSEAVSNTAGTAVFYDGGDVSNSNSLVKTSRAGEKINVSLTSIDKFVKDGNLKIDCLKIDVEGNELNVLYGARETFLNQMPVTRLGLHPAFIVSNGQCLNDIWNVFEEYNLKVIYQNKEIFREEFCGHLDLFDVSLYPIKL